MTTTNVIPMIAAPKKMRPMKVLGHTVRFSEWSKDKILIDVFRLPGGREHVGTGVFDRSSVPASAAVLRAEIKRLVSAWISEGADAFVRVGAIK